MMGRIWLASLVVTLVALASSDAEAKRAELCQCAETRSYPELDASDIPTNQKAIEIRPFDEAEPFKITSLGELEPDTDYHFDNAPFLRFHTAKGPDWHVPSAPTSISPSIVIRNPSGADRFDTQTSIRLAGDFGDDARFLEVFIEGADGKKAHFGMGAWNPQLCGQPLRLSPGPATITVWAVDRAGQRSAAPWKGEVIIVGIDEDPTAGECEMRNRHHYRCGMGAMMEFFAGAVMLFIELIVLLVVALLRGSRVRNWPGEHVSIPLAESVARLARRTKVIKLFVALAACTVLWQSDHGITAVLLSPIALYWLIDVARAHAVVHRFEQPVNRLERRADWLLVDHTLLYCGRRAWVRASHLPSATLRPPA